MGSFRPIIDWVHQKLMISIFQTYHLSTLPLEVRNKTGLLKMCEALCLRTHPLTNLEITRKLMSNER